MTENTAPAGAGFRTERICVDGFTLTVDTSGPSPVTVEAFSGGDQCAALFLSPREARQLAADLFQAAYAADFAGTERRRPGFRPDDQKGRAAA